jgi:hypothetical protein
MSNEIEPVNLPIPIILQTLQKDQHLNQTTCPIAYWLPRPNDLSNHPALDIHRSTDPLGQ